MGPSALTSRPKQRIGGSLTEERDGRPASAACSGEVKHVGKPQVRALRAQVVINTLQENELAETTKSVVSFQGPSRKIEKRRSNLIYSETFIRYHLGLSSGGIITSVKSRPCKKLWDSVRVELEFRHSRINFGGERPPVTVLILEDAVRNGR
jgi:hypothetical protein